MDLAPLVQRSLPSREVTPRNSNHLTRQPLNRSFGYSPNKLIIFHTQSGRKDGLYRPGFPIKVSLDWKNAGTVLHASSMEEVYDKLAMRLLSLATTAPPSRKIMVGLAGPPGAGKSTVVNEVAKRLNMLWHQENATENSGVQDTLQDIAVSLPMDGFHLYRWQLDAMEDPIEAHARRGAPWTFDPAGLVKFLTTLRSQGWGYAPSFDHGIGDPIENDIFISPSHKVILIEGNYLLLPANLWKDLAGIFDERWFLNVDIDTAMKRVEQRHIKTGKSPKEAKQRVEGNDRKNAELIMTSKVFADLVIQSIEIEG